VPYPQVWLLNSTSHPPSKIEPPPTTPVLTPSVRLCRVLCAGYHQSNDATGTFRQRSIFFIERLRCVRPSLSLPNARSTNVRFSVPELSVPSVRFPLRVDKPVHGTVKMSSSTLLLASPSRRHHLSPVKPMKSNRTRGSNSLLNRNSCKPSVHFSWFSVRFSYLASFYRFPRFFTKPRAN
jgi:hypothetical protein